MSRTSTEHERLSMIYRDGQDQGQGQRGVVRDDVCGNVSSDLHDGDLAALGQRAAVRTELMGEVSNVSEQ